MIQSVYKAILQFEEVGGDLIARLRSMGLNEVFEPIITNYGDEPVTFNKVLFYLIHAYSRESELHIANADWGQVKKNAAEKAGINSEEETGLYLDLYDLRTVEIARTIRLYLDYQAGRDLKHMLMLKDLYEQMLNSAIENITDKDNVVNYNQKFQNAQYAEKLYLKIAEWEQRIEQNELAVNKGREELRRVEKKNNFSLRMEDNITRE